HVPPSPGVGASRARLAECKNAAGREAPRARPGTFRRGTVLQGCVERRNGTVRGPDLATRGSYDSARLRLASGGVSSANSVGGRTPEQVGLKSDIRSTLRRVQPMSARNTGRAWRSKGIILCQEREVAELSLSRNGGQDGCVQAARRSYRW